MLVAVLGSERVDAAVSIRRPDYYCPECNGLVVLHHGRIVIAHFKHKPPTNCAWAKGETKAHLEAKRLVFAALSGRGLKAQIECIIPAMPGDRRADVMVRSPKGRQIAVELQHTSIGVDEIERRAFSYAKAGITQIWIPFIPSSVWRDGKRAPGGWFVEKYAARPFERWIHGLNRKRGMWMYDPGSKSFWLGTLVDHELYIEETSWFEDGDEHYGGGFYRTSKRFKELTLIGPYSVDALLIERFHRSYFSTSQYKWPAGRIAHLIPISMEANGEQPRTHA